MAKEHLNKIFLSASIPYPDRDRKFYDTADIVAIRDAVKALATVVIPSTQLIWGGHPAITPLIRYVCEKMNTNLKKHVTLYQSEFFRGAFPDDNFSFENIVLTPKEADRERSLTTMRNEMIEKNEFVAGVFIGGMEGVIEEYRAFSQLHPDALVLPVASTGAAAKIIFDGIHTGSDKRLLDNYAYMALFQDLLKDYL